MSCEAIKKLQMLTKRIKERPAVLVGVGRVLGPWCWMGTS